MSPDPWHLLRRHTAARIALGRCGGSLPTREVLDFSMAHAAARDAVYDELDVDSLAAAIELPVIHARSAAADRTVYLQRPDLGRQLGEPLQPSPADVAIIVADGLSAQAAQRHAPPLLAVLVPLLKRSGISISPIVIVRQARVAIEDPIGQQLGTMAALILLGERPGLQSADSLGAYLVFDPMPGRTDAQRNCVSNICPTGLPIATAARTLHYLLVESLRRKISGVELKDEQATPVFERTDAPAISSS